MIHVKLLTLLDYTQHLRLASSFFNALTWGGGGVVVVVVVVGWGGGEEDVTFGFRYIFVTLYFYFSSKHFMEDINHRIKRRFL